jgi:hypothetical protein
MESAGRYITRTITFGMNENPSRLLEEAFAQLDREGYRLVTVIHTVGNMGRVFRWPLPAAMEPLRRDPPGSVAGSICPPIAGQGPETLSARGWGAHNLISSGRPPLPAGSAAVVQAINVGAKLA